MERPFVFVYPDAAGDRYSMSASGIHQLTAATHTTEGETNITKNNRNNE